MTRSYSVTTLSRTLSGTKLTVPKAVLRGQLSVLLDRGYEGGLLPGGGHRRRRHRGRLAVTFDDAERSVLDRALPVLAELGLTGTVFVPVVRVGDGAMPWDDLLTLALAGWEIGSHTLSHPRLTRVSMRPRSTESYAARARRSRTRSAGRAARSHTRTAR